jgi:hypothetical protein
MIVVFVVFLVLWWWQWCPYGVANWSQCTSVTAAQAQVEV